MKNYLVIKSKKEMNNVCDRFKKYFEIDLDDEKYAVLDVKEAWELVVQDIFGVNYRIDYISILKEYITKLDTLASGKRLVRTDGIFRSPEYEDELMRECRKGLQADMRKISNIVHSYSILESDIWINAYLSYRLIMNIDEYKNKVEDTSIWSRTKHDKKLYVVNYSCLGFCETFRNKYLIKKALLEVYLNMKKIHTSVRFQIKHC